MDIESLKNNWKLVVISSVAVLATGFGLGRLTADKPSVVVDTKTEVIKKEETKIDLKVEENRVVTTEKGPVKISTKKKTTKPSGEVIEEDSTTEEAPVKVVDASTKVETSKTETKKEETVKSETRTEITTVSRNWLLGLSAPYGISDVLTQKWTTPSVEGQIGYRVFSGVYPTLTGGYDLSTGKAKVGVGLVVTF